MQISADEYDRFREMLELSSGIVLGSGKEYLVVSRLRRLLERYSLTSISDLLARIPANHKLHEEIIDAMTTNETQWFRDEHPYRIFRERILPDLASRYRPFRIWSAACSTGQEPYSLSIEIEEYRKRSPGALATGEKILATDISPTSLTQARAGVYPQLAIRRGMNEQHLKNYFQPVDNDRWKINDKIRSRVEFLAHNLQQDYEVLGKFDVIFCRNVLIYFSADLKYDILKRMHGCLNPDGYLVLGASESPNRLAEYFDMVPCHPGIIYRARKL